MTQIGYQLLADSKAAIKSGGLERITPGRDLLSLLVQANMSPDVPEHQRLSDADVVARTSGSYIHCR